MKNYITFEKAELKSVITTLGNNLQTIADSIAYFQQYAKLKGVQHDYMISSALVKINESLGTLKHEFNLPIEPNICLDPITQITLDKVIERVNKAHAK